MASVALQQVSSAFARANAKRTLEKRVGIKFLKGILNAEQQAHLDGIAVDGGVFVWGSKFERYHQEWKIDPKQCVMLFRRGDHVFKVGLIALKLNNEALAELLWGRDTDGQTWSLIYFFKQVHEVDISVKVVNRILGYQPTNHWQGFVVV